MVTAWVRHGHYTIGASPRGHHGNNVVPSSIPGLQLSLAVQTKELLRALGVIASHLMWLWCEEEGETEMDIAFLVRDSMDRHIRQFNSDHAIKANKTKDPYWQTVAFKMILSLDGTLQPELRSRLAKVSHVQKLYSALYD